MKIKTNNNFRTFEIAFFNGKKEYYVLHLGLNYSVDEFLPISDEMKEEFPCLKGWSYIRTTEKGELYFQKDLVVQTRNDFTEYKIGSIDYE